MDFYFRFVVPNRSLIESGRSEKIMTMTEQRLFYYVSAR